MLSPSESILECKLLKVQAATGEKESFEEDTQTDRPRYLARRVKNESRKSNARV